MFVINSNTKTNECQSENVAVSVKSCFEDMDYPCELPEKRWKEKKKMSREIAELVAKYDSFKADRIKNCGKWLVFGATDDGLKLRQANFCRERICPMCTWRRSIRIGLQMEELYTELKKRDYPLMHVVFTVENVKGAELSGCIDGMMAAFKYLTQQSSIYKKSFCGFYRALEITYNADEDTYHPHLHCIFAARPDYFDGYFVSKDKLISAWRKALKCNYDPSVWMDMLEPDKNGSLTGAVKELTKYAFKSVDVLSAPGNKKQVEVLKTIDYTLKNRRLLSFGGVFAEMRRMLKQDDIEADNADLVGVKRDKFVDRATLVYVWRSGCYFLYNSEL